MIPATWVRTGPRSSPGVPAIAFVGRLVLALTSVSTPFALLGLLTSWSSYSSPGLVFVAWLLTGSVLPVAVWSVARRGVLTDGMFAGLTAALYLVDVVVPLTVRPPLRTGVPTWNWGAVSLVLLGFAAYRRAGQVIAVAAGHAAIGVAYAFIGTDPASVDRVAVVVLISGCLLPPAAAAQFVGRYAQALRERQAAMDEHRSMLSGKAAEDDGRQSILDRVSRLRGEMLSLFDAVANGEALLLDDGARGRAQALARALRRELDESRSRGWLRGHPLGGNPGEDSSVEVNVSGSPDLLDDSARAAIAAVVEMLATYHWERMGLTITAASPTTGSPAPARDPSGESISVTIVAEGSSSTAAAQNEAVRAAAANIGGTPWQDMDGPLVIEGAITASQRTGPHPRI